MADDLEITIDTKALDDALSGLSIRVQKKIVRKALQAGADVVLASMKALCPERTDEPTPDSNGLPPGILREDLQVDIRVSQTSGASARIGPGEIAGYVGRWVNNGYNLTSHGPKRNRKVIKPIPGKHFMEASTDEAGQKAVDAMVEVVASELGAGGDDAPESGTGE